ncbi:hypothetical protein CVD28_05995 [Bacillus sp. M6-12]|nr:hypothetical protein CVD28_05995 [Bacillus sp. M6-12]
MHYPFYYHYIFSGNVPLGIYLTGEGAKLPFLLALVRDMLYNRNQVYNNRSSSCGYYDEKNHIGFPNMRFYVIEIINTFILVLTFAPDKHVREELRLLCKISY